MKLLKCVKKQKTKFGCTLMNYLMNLFDDNNDDDDVSGSSKVH